MRVATKSGNLPCIPGLDDAVQTMRESHPERTKEPVSRHVVVGKLDRLATWKQLGVDLSSTHK